MEVDKDLGNQGANVQKTNTINAGKVFSHLNIRAEIAFFMIFDED